MPNHPSLQPLGEILKAADLISAAQIEVALRDQQNYHLRIGEILDLRGWLNQETSDFFAEHWSHLLKSSSRYPLGYYLQLSSLLNEEQICTILQEQKQMGIRFGAVAVLKGWLKKRTIDYFLENLTPHTVRMSDFQDKSLVSSFEKVTYPQKGTRTNPTIFMSKSLINIPNIDIQLDSQICLNNHSKKKNFETFSSLKKENIKTYPDLDHGEEIHWID